MRARGFGRPAVLAGLFAVLVVSVYADPLFLRKNFAGRDLLGYNLPIESAIHDAYSRGRLPVWLSEVSGGRPLLANPNSGAFYPVRPALALLPFPIAFRLYPVLHWIAAGLGCFLLARVLGASDPAAWLAAVTYAFSGIGVSEVFYSNYQPGMTLLPWVLWSLVRPGAAAPKAVATSLLLGLDIFAGDVFTISLALGACILWVLTETPSVQRIRVLYWLFVSTGLALLLTAPQWVASLHWAPQTHRAVLGMTLRDVLGFSVSPFRLLEFLIPFPFGPTWSLESSASWGQSLFRGRSVGFFSSFYCGAFALISLVALWRRPGAGGRFLRAFWLAAVAVAVLPSFIPLAWSAWTSPLPLRFPEKFCVAFALVFAVSAARGLDHWRRQDASRAWTLGVGAGLAGLALFCSLFPGSAARLALRVTDTPPMFAGAAAAGLAPAFAEAGLLWMATVIALPGLRGKRPVFALSVALLSLVPIAANRRIARTFRQEEVFAPTAFARFVSRADPTNAYRVLGIQLEPKTEASYLPRDIANLEYSRRTWLQYTPTLWKRGMVFNQDLDIGDLSRMESLRRLSAMALAAGGSESLFAGLALRWQVRMRGQASPRGYHRVAGDGMQDWDETPHPYPDIRLLQRWREENETRKIVSAINALEPGEVLLETDSSRRGAARPGSVKIIEKTPEELVLETESPDPGWLFVLRGFWEHRKVSVDGRPAEVVPAQIAFSAVAVPSGRHRIQWRESVPGAGSSVAGPLLFLLAALWLGVRGLPRGGASSV